MTHLSNKNVKKNLLKVESTIEIHLTPYMTRRLKFLYFTTKTSYEKKKKELWKKFNSIEHILTWSIHNNMANN